MSNVLSPRDLVSRPDNMDETVLLSYTFVGKKGLIVYLVAMKRVKWHTLLYYVTYRDPKSLLQNHSCKG